MTTYLKKSFFLLALCLSSTLFSNTRLDELKMLENYFEKENSPRRELFSESSARESIDQMFREQRLQESSLGISIYPGGLEQKRKKEQLEDRYNRKRAEQEAYKALNR